MRETDEPLLRGLGSLLRDETERDADASAEAAGAARLATGVAANASRRPPRRLPAQVGWSLAGAGLLLAVLVAYLAWPGAALQYEVEGAVLSEGGYVAAPARDGARIRFSDGSEVQLGVDSSVRVSTVTEFGARLQLEHGQIDVSVVHSNDTAWFVDAGPYEIEVTGTRFSVVWSQRDRTLRTTLSEGAVTVRGPLAPGGVLLEAGQELVAREGEGEIRLSRISEDATAPLEGAEQRTADDGVPPPDDDDRDALDPSPQSANSAAGATAAVEPTKIQSWSKRVAEGDFERVFAEAEASGIERVLGSGSGGDVSALSDAARYVGRGDVHHKALLALRKRFPESPAARNAAFLLGRMVHDGGSPSGAIPWYDRYLSESPGGMFSAEALGRKMVAVQSVQGADAARPLARAYLKSSPKGGFANVARDIMKR